MIGNRPNCQNCICRFAANNANTALIWEGREDRSNNVFFGARSDLVEQAAKEEGSKAVAKRGSGRGLFLEMDAGV